jgi:hypothetical protein
MPGRALELPMRHVLCVPFVDPCLRFALECHAK